MKEPDKMLSRLICQAIVSEEVDDTPFVAERVRYARNTKMLSELSGDANSWNTPEPKPWRPRINVASETQRALMKHELQGQISDGHWENARPYDHWKHPAMAEVHVDPSNVGTNFHPLRKYNFAAPELLSVVGKRMLSYARLAKHFGSADADHLSHNLDLDGNWDHGTGYLHKYGGPDSPFLQSSNRENGERQHAHVKGQLDALHDVMQRHGVSHEDVHRITNDDNLYSKKDLHADLAALKDTFAKRMVNK